MPLFAKDTVYFLEKSRYNRKNIPMRVFRCFRWRGAPLPPLEGEVVERQRNRRGLYVTRAVKPLCDSLSAAYGGCSLA